VPRSTLSRCLLTIHVRTVCMCSQTTTFRRERASRPKSTGWSFWSPPPWVLVCAPSATGSSTEYYGPRNQTILAARFGHNGSPRPLVSKMLKSTGVGASVRLSSNGPCKPDVVAVDHAPNIGVSIANSSPCSLLTIQKLKGHTHQVRQHSSVEKFSWAFVERVTSWHRVQFVKLQFYRYGTVPT